MRRVEQHHDFRALNLEGKWLELRCPDNEVLARRLGLILVFSSKPRTSDSGREFAASRSPPYIRRTIPDALPLLQINLGSH